MVVFRIKINSNVADKLQDGLDWVVDLIDNKRYWTRWSDKNGLTFKFACGGAGGMHYEVWRHTKNNVMRRLELGTDFRNFGLGWGGETFPWGGGIKKIRIGFLVIGIAKDIINPEQKSYYDYEDKQEYLRDNPNCAAVVDSSGEETIVYERENNK